MKTFKLLLGAAAILALFACKKSHPAIQPRQEVVFTSNVRTFSGLKSSATSLDENDLVSLYAGEPINAENVRMTITEGKLVPETKLFWGYNQESATSFEAYYPYMDYKAENFVFSVAENQSYQTSFMLSDLMKATAEAAPQDGEVFLDFYHQLSKISILLDNNLGIGIYSVKMKNVYTSTDLESPVGEPGDVMAFHASGNTYQLIVVPQTCTPSIIITTEEGDKFEYVIKSEATLEAGKAYTASISLGESIGFNFAVNEWESAGSLDFGASSGEVEDEDDMTPDPTPQPGMNTVDLGLSVLWASCDLGAEDEMHKGTQAFAWGETTPRTFDASWSNYKWSNGAFDKLTKYNYNADYGTVDNRRQLEAEDDAASVILGNGWRMPTYDEAMELYDYTKQERVKYNGQWVLKLTSKKAGYTDKYIIFAECNYNNYYWTSTLYSSRPDEACCFSAKDSPFFYPYYNNSRITSLLIRPVMDK